MSKPGTVLGLGLGSTKKADLAAYLRGLEKKNKEVARKHSVGAAEESGGPGEQPDIRCSHSTGT